MPGFRAGGQGGCINPRSIAQAAEALIAEGQAQGARLPRLCQRAGLSRPQDGFIDGLIYDGQPATNAAICSSSPSALEGR